MAPARSLKTLNLGRPWAQPGSTTTVTALRTTSPNPARRRWWGRMCWWVRAIISGSWVSVRRGMIRRVVADVVEVSSPVVEISAAGTHALALLADGTVWSTGSNGEGSLGDGTKTDRFVWGIVPGLSNVISITTTLWASHALTANGDVWAWGDGVNAQLGQEDSSKWGTQWPSPQKVKSLPGATQLASTALRTVFALMSDGTVKSWCRLVVPARRCRWEPAGTAATIAGLTDVVQLASGFGGGGLALKSDGTVWRGATTTRSAAVRRHHERAADAGADPRLTGVTQISGGPGRTTASAAVRVEVRRNGLGGGRTAPVSSVTAPRRIATCRCSEEHHHGHADQWIDHLGIRAAVGQPRRGVG